MNHKPAEKAPLPAKHRMWRKGREVLKAYPDLQQRIGTKGRGSVDHSFHSIEQATGRDRRTIGAWVKLALAIEKTEPWRFSRAITC